MEVVSLEEDRTIESVVRGYVHTYILGWEGLLSCCLAVKMET